MTRIVDGYAQADIEATHPETGETIIAFVETHDSLGDNARALQKSLGWLKQHRPEARVKVVVAKPKSRKEG